MAKLSVIVGKNKGASYALDGERFLVGRESAGEIALNDSSVSRRHCVIERRRDNRFFVRDLQSLNGTAVNGVELGEDEERLLRDGDKIRVGDYVLVFSEKDSAARDSSVSSAVIFDETRLDLSQTVRVSFEEMVGAMARDLAALLQISEKINAVRGAENLRQELLRQILGVIPASEAAILLADDEGEISEVSGFNRAGDGGESADVSVSRTVVNQVLREQTVILANDVSRDAAVNQAESLFVAQTASLLCVPLVLFEKTLGAIYLSASKTRVRFDESHLRFLTAVAGIAAVAVENARNLELLERENARLREETLSEKNMLGASEAMRKVFAFIQKAAPTDATVLLNGESGTGKELAARAIHLNSKRRDKPFVAINCAALTETLLESELFGHEKGAFTGAVAQKTGKIEMASGGTLFLDEVGEMPLILQAKLLRVLQEREYERVGGTKTLKANIRLVAATNRDLEAEVAAGNFRQDLFYRLNVVRLTMPPLRERKDDVLPLAENFVEKFARQLNRRVRGLSTKTKKLLLAHDYPGNVRELENAVERAVVLGAGEWIRPEDLPENFCENEVSAAAGEFTESDSALNYQEAITARKKELIRQAFTEAKGSYTEAARLLDVHPNYLHRLIRNLNIKEELERLL
jgi:Nif-specific regulatory protein